MKKDEAAPHVLGLIPARGGSKGIPDKNLAPLVGKPLIAYTIEASLQSRLLTDFIVSTDSPVIRDFARSIGARAPFLRPAELATDSARMQDVALHALDSCQADGQFEYILLLQPTSPLRSAHDIDESIKIAAKFDATSVLSFADATPFHPFQLHFLERETSVNRGRVRPAFTSEIVPRQEFPRTVFRNGAIFLTRISYLRERNSFASADVVPYLMPPNRSVNVDGPEDLLWAEFLLSRA